MTYNPKEAQYLTQSNGHSKLDATAGKMFFLVAFVIVAGAFVPASVAETIVSTSTVKVLRCHDDIVREYNGKFVWVNVDWREPKFISLVAGKRVKKIASMRNGGPFFLGVRHTVVYNAAINHTSGEDIAECSFTVLVKPKPCPCPTIRNPTETALACVDGKCAVLCKDGYNPGDTQILFCQQGEWKSSFTRYPAECVPGKGWQKTYTGNVTDPAVVTEVKRLGLNAMHRVRMCQRCRTEQVDVIGGL